MKDTADLAALTMAVELAELRAQLAEAQDMLIEIAIDAGHLHARISKSYRPNSRKPQRA